jgi:hypothetical protein
MYPLEVTRLILAAPDPKGSAAERACAVAPLPGGIGAASWLGPAVPRLCAVAVVAHGYRVGLVVVGASELISVARVESVRQLGAAIPARRELLVVGEEPEPPVRGERADCPEVAFVEGQQVAGGVPGGEDHVDCVGEVEV